MRDANGRPPRPAIPWGLVGMLVLVVAVDRLAIQRNLALTSDQALSWKFAGREARRRATGADVLFFGDSMVKMGLLPRVIKEKSGRTAYNLALYNGVAPASYFLFRRALEAGARPSAVVVNFTAGILSEGPQTKVRPFSWSELLSPREALDLAWTARDANLLARIAAEQAIPALRKRFDIRTMVLWALASDPNRAVLRNHRSALLGNWGQNRGAQLNPMMMASEIPPPSGPSPPCRWRPHPVNLHYLRQFVALAAEHRIRVYWILPPFHPGWQVWMEHQGEDARFAEFIREVQAGHDNVVVLDGRHSGYRSKDFVDVAHLNPTGELELSGAVATVLGEPGDSSTSGRRWVSLPPRRPAADGPGAADRAISAVGPPEQERRR